MGLLLDLLQLLGGKWLHLTGLKLLDGAPHRWQLPALESAQ
jgi:hypothetical protein